MKSGHPLLCVLRSSHVRHLELHVYSLNSNVGLFKASCTNSQKDKNLTLAQEQNYKYF